MAKKLDIVRELFYQFSSYHLKWRGSTMLTLSHVIEDTYNVEVDYYTPLTIECSSFPSYMRKAYFRLLGDNSLLEIGINPDSFRLMNIILVQVSNVTLMDDMSLEEVEEIEGIPVFRDTVMFTIRGCCRHGSADDGRTDRWIVAHEQWGHSTGRR